MADEEVIDDDPVEEDEGFVDEPNDDPEALADGEDVLVEDDLDEHVLVVDDDVADDVVVEEESPEEEAAAAPTPKARADDEEDDEDEDSDDVEEDLAVILKERIAASDDEEDDEEDEVPVDDRTETGDRIPPRAAEEFSCPECFLLVRRSQFSARRTDCPGGLDGADCPVKRELGLV